jgi:Ca-activated chloride channel family protein
MLPKKPTAEMPERKVLPTEGIAIYLVLDRSGSMGELISVGRERRSKLDLLKQVTAQFIQGNPELGLTGRHTDMIGLVAFARVPNVLSPLTLDHKAILKLLSQLDVVKDKNLDGTAIGYAIYKTANLIAATRLFAKDLQGQGKPAYEIKNSVILLVTDGFQDPSLLDKGNRVRTIELQEAAQYALEQGVRLYIINVEPKIASEQFAPQRHLMQSIAEMTGGKFYLATSVQGLAEIYSEIDNIEKSLLPEEAITAPIQPKRRVSFFPYLIALGMLCLLLAVLLKTTILKTFP